MKPKYRVKYWAKEEGWKKTGLMSKAGAKIIAKTLKKRGYDFIEIYEDDNP